MFIFSCVHELFYLCCVLFVQFVFCKFHVCSMCQMFKCLSFHNIRFIIAICIICMRFLVRRMFIRNYQTPKTYKSYCLMCSMFKKNTNTQHVLITRHQQLAVSKIQNVCVVNFIVYYFPTNSTLLCLLVFSHIQRVFLEIKQHITTMAQHKTQHHKFKNKHNYNSSIS